MVHLHVLLDLLLLQPDGVLKPFIVFNELSFDQLILESCLGRASDHRQDALGRLRLLLKAHFEFAVVAVAAEGAVDPLWLLLVSLRIALVVRILAVNEFLVDIDVDVESRIDQGGSLMGVPVLGGQVLQVLGLRRVKHRILELVFVSGDRWFTLHWQLDIVLILRLLLHECYFLEVVYLHLLELQIPGHGRLSFGHLKLDLIEELLRRLLLLAVLYHLDVGEALLVVRRVHDLVLEELAYVLLEDVLVEVELLDVGSALGLALMPLLV